MCNQRIRLSVVIEDITEHYSMGSHANRIDFGYMANDFRESCKNEEDEKTIPYLLYTCPALCQNRKSRLCVQNVYNLNDLSMIDIDISSRLIKSAEWLEN